jgi:organic radical activating enzyme
MSEKITVRELIIETTRRCNMNCGHCVRGDAQNQDFDIKYLDKLLEKLFFVDIITPSGGEPSLVPHIINNIVDAFEKNEVGVNSCGIVTNGKYISDDFILACKRLISLCENNRKSVTWCSRDPYRHIMRLHLSRDKFHETGEIIDQNRDKLRKIGHYWEDIFAFSEDDRFRHQIILKEGRAKNFGTQEISDKLVIENGYEKNEVVLDLIYVNCFGEIFSDCCLSYDSQDKKDRFYLCHVDDFSLDVLRECIRKQESKELCMASN